MAEKRQTAHRAARTAVTSRFVVLTGVSGSGKSQAIRALEDLGYFCVDNLPVTLLPMLAELTLRAGSEIARAAVVVDVREGKLLTEFPAIYRRLKTNRSLNPVLIFLEASEPALVRRFSETRRPHPLAKDRSAIEGHPRGAQGDARDPQHGGSHRRHVRHDRPRTAARVHQRRQRPRAGHAAGRHRS